MCFLPHYGGIAVDFDPKLLDELKNNAGTLAIETVQDDLINFDKHTTDKAELIVCMSDTLIHLESKDMVLSLFKKVFAALEETGRFIITFRDMSSELTELDRFIPVKSDQDIIFTCFLEYEPETVKVHDIIYKRDKEEWRLNKSFYRKLRLSEVWVVDQLSSAGFTHIQSTIDSGFVTVIAEKRDQHLLKCGGG